MFYVLSKLFWLVAQPLSLLILLGCAALVLAFTPLKRTLRATLAILAVAGGLFAFSNLGQMSIAPLEQRFARPDGIPAGTVGAIVLGGAVDSRMAAAYRGYELNSAGDRLVEALRLALTRPALKIVVTGGVGDLEQTGDGDGVAAQRFFKAFGVQEDRLMFETRSRNTYENAVDTKALLGPEAKRKWLLITSAFHMPRAVGVFRAQGFDVVPWPVDYRAPPHPQFGFDAEHEVLNLSTLTIAVREWIGLLAYRIAGKTDSLLPQ